MNKLILILFLIFKVSTIQSQDCKLYSRDFDVRAEDYPKFANDLRSFYASNYEYDLVVMKIKGGNPTKSYLTRLYFEDDWIKYKNTDGEMINTQILDIDSISLDTLFNSVSKGRFISICPYSSANDTYIYLIKKDSEVIFKYISSFPGFSDVEQDHIKGIVKLIDIAKP